MILYQFDAQNVKTDALAQRSNDQLFEKIENRLEHQIKTLLSFDKLKIQSIDIEKNDEKISKKLTFVEKISRANEKNEICSKTRRRRSKMNKICLIIRTISLKKNFFIKKIDCEFRIWIT